MFHVSSTERESHSTPSNSFGHQGSPAPAHMMTGPTWLFLSHHVGLVTPQRQCHCIIRGGFSHTCAVKDKSHRPSHFVNRLANSALGLKVCKHPVTCYVLHHLHQPKEHRDLSAISIHCCGCSNPNLIIVLCKAKQEERVTHKYS